MVADKDHVAASFIYPGTHKGTYFGIAPTGRSLRFTSCDIFRVQDERIVEHWGMGDIAVSWHNSARDISFEEMSAIGIKRTFVFALRTSAIGGKADIALTCRHVCF